MRVPAAGICRALAAAALVLAVTSRGELAVLGLLLVLPDVRLTTLVAVTGAVVASSWRWGTTSLEALAGAQAVLGPAGGVGSAGEAAGSWLAALALLLALGRGDEPLRWVAVGATVAAVLAGPAPGGDLPVRVAVGLGVTVAAYGLATWRAERPRPDRILAVLAGAAGVAALGAVVAASAARPATIEVGLVGEGALIAAAVGILALVAGRIEARSRWSDRGVSPTVEPRPAASVAPPHHSR